MKTKADRELKGISQKAFNKTNHIIKIISCLCLSMFILCQPLSFCVPVNAETIDDDIVMTDNISNDSNRKQKSQARRRMNVRSFVSVLLRILSIMSMKMVSDEDLATNSCRLLPAMQDGNSST
mgnify:CR=1 FL=1